MYDSFALQGPHGTHFYLVHQPLGISLGELKELTPDGLFSPKLIRQTLRCILAGLQFLHKSESYTLVSCPKDISFSIGDSYPYLEFSHLQPSNMLLGTHDVSMLAKFEQ